MQSSFANGFIGCVLYRDKWSDHLGVFNLPPSPQYGQAARFLFTSPVYLQGIFKLLACSEFFETRN